AQANLRVRSGRMRNRRLGAHPDPADATRLRVAQEGRALGRLRQVRRALGQGRVAARVRDDRRRSPRHRRAPRGARAMNDLQLAPPGIGAEAHVEWVWSDDDGDEEAAVKDFAHATVMRDEVVHALAPRDGGVYVDVTLGGGGHSEAILELADRARLIAFD